MKATNSTVQGCCDKMTKGEVKMSLYSRFGEMEYYSAELPENGWKWCYSAAALQRLLADEITAQKIKGIYVWLYGYLVSLEMSRQKPDIIDMSYLGCGCLIVLERTAVELAIHAEGMFEYRLYPSSEVKLKKHYSLPPEDIGLSGQDYFYDVKNTELSYSFTGEAVQSVKTNGTIAWPFALEGFDEELAETAGDKNDLPESVQIITKSCTICFIGDSIEYGLVVFKPGSNT